MHCGEMTLVFLEGVASRSPHGSAMCEKMFSTTMVVYHWRRLCVSGQYLCTNVVVVYHCQ
jgi:hypothetical protein